MALPSTAALRDEPTPWHDLLGDAVLRAWGRGNPPPIYPARNAAAAASALAIAFAFAFVVAGEPACSPVAAALLAFATGTWTVSADQLWTHGPAQAAVLLSFYWWSEINGCSPVCLQVSPSWSGRISGWLPCILGVERSCTTRRESHSDRCRAAVGAAILLAYNNALWGGISIFGGYNQPVVSSEHKIAALITGFVGDFVSPERGLLVMTPALLLLLPGTRAAWRVAPEWVRWCGLAGFAYLALQLWGIRFSGGDGFYSYRTTLETLSLCVPLLTLTWREWTSKTRARRTIFAALATTSVALHAFGAVTNWVPGGVSDRPWQTYLPDDLARHIGAAQTSAWLAGTVIAVVTATVLTWRGQQPSGANPEAPHFRVAAA